MNPRRRTLLTAALLAPLLPARLARSEQVPDVLIRINIPGPNALPFLPIDLIPQLGFDHEMGARLVVRYHPSGIRAIEDVLAGNADLAALGFSTLPVLAAKGKDVVAISPLSGRTAAFSLVVRKDLAKSIRRVADLAGHTIATSTGSVNSKTYLQMAGEAVLKMDGIGSHQVRWLPTAQNWDSISGAMIGKVADGVFCEEPFTSRLVREGLGVVLTDFSDIQVADRISGLNHLRSAIVTTRATLRSQPEKTEMFVRMLRRTLVWMQTTPPEQVVQKAPARTAAERQEIALLLRKAPGMWSSDGRFSTSQVVATDVFLRAALPEARLAPAESLIDDRWSGRRP